MPLCFKTLLNTKQHTIGVNLISCCKYPPNVPLNVYLIQELRYRQNLFTSSPGIFPNKNIQEAILSLTLRLIYDSIYLLKENI